MSGKHEIGCDCRDCMTYLGTHISVDIDQWMPDDASLAGFGTRDAPTTSTETTKATILTTPQKSVTTKATILTTPHKNVHSPADHATGNQKGLASGPSTIPTTIRDAKKASVRTLSFMERIENGNFATHDPEDVDRFNKLMNKYLPNSNWIKDNIYADYVNREGNFKVGQRFRKKFSSKWYSGIITSWDGDNKLYHVKYDDGDSEDLDRDEMPECLLSHEENETIATEKNEAHAKCQQRIRDAQKASIGRRIRKKFSNKWYSGIINSWDGENKLYHVKYDDGDSEDLDHDEMHECLLHHEQNEDKKEAHVKRQQRFRDAKKASVRTNTFRNNHDCDLSNNVYCLEC